MAELHFLRPLWWLAWLPGLALIVLVMRAQAGGGAWRRVVDRALQPVMLIEAGTVGPRRWPFVAAVLAWTLGIVALAGPAWERLPVPVMRSQDALVVALDLSRSMDAPDLSPSRLARAKLKLLSLLDRRAGGQTGLVVFSGHAFTVTPLTTDTQTIGALIAALSTDIMPSGGSRIDRGLNQAAQLLRDADMTEGRILLLTDAAPSRDTLDAAAALRRDGYTVSVLGIGTQEGAPIPERSGGFLLDGAGNVVVPKLDPAALAELADRGGGRYSVMTTDERDLDRLLPENERPEAAELAAVEGEEAVVADAWEDAGLWVALLLLPLLALGFRRGVVACWVAVIVLLPPPAAAQPGAPAERPAPGSAQEGSLGDGLGDLWASLWRRPDQRGAAALSEQRPERAAQLFEDPRWRSAAQYRAGNYEASAETLARLDTATAHYNRGNALARSGSIEEAIAAYDRALELEPDHEDAQFNRELLRQHLAANPPAQSQDADQGEAGEDGQSGQSGERQSAGNESGAGGEQGDRSGADERSAAASEGESGRETGDRDGEGDAGQTADERSPAEAGDGESSSGSGDEGFADAEVPEGARFGDAGQGDAEPGEDTPANEAPVDASALTAVSPDDAEALEEWASSQSADQWLRRVPQDPGGLLRRKFLYQYQRLGLDREAAREAGETW